MFREVLLLVAFLCLPLAAMAQEVPVTGEVYSICQYVQGGGWSEPINILSKDGSQNATVNAYFYDNDGKPLDVSLEVAGQQVQVASDGARTFTLGANDALWVKPANVGPLQVGHAVITSNRKLGVLGTLKFGRSTVSVTSCPTQRNLELPADFVQLANSLQSTGFAVANNNSYPVTVDVLLFERGGAYPAEQIVLPAKGHKSIFIHELFQTVFNNLPVGEFHGKMKLAASAEISAMSLGTESFSDGDFRFNSSPAQAPATNQAAFRQEQTYLFVASNLNAGTGYEAGVQFLCNVRKRWFDNIASLHGQLPVSDLVDFRKDANGNCSVMMVKGQKPDAFYAAEATRGFPTISQEIRNWELTNQVQTPGLRFVIYLSNETATGVTNGIDAFVPGPNLGAGTTWANFSWGYVTSACANGNMSTRARNIFTDVLAKSRSAVHEHGHRMRLEHRNDLHEADPKMANVMVGNPYQSISGAPAGIFREGVETTMNTCGESWLETSISSAEMKTIREWRDSQ